MWCTNIKNRMTADTLECDVIKAEALKEKHNEHLVSCNLFSVKFFALNIVCSIVLKLKLNY